MDTDARGIMIEPTRQVPENPLSLLGGRTVPSLTQYLDNVPNLSHFRE
jgi:hypothetical protein